MMKAILNSSILDSAILHKKLHSFILTHLMMAAILNSPILDSDTLLSSLRFTPKHSHSTLTLTQTNSVWLKLIHSPLTWWWQPFWILPSWIFPSWIQIFCIKYFTHSFWLIWWWQPSWILHLGFRHLVIFSQIHSKTLSLHSDSDSNKFSLTQTHSFSLNLMMAAILNSAILDSDNAILDSETLLSSLSFTQKHSHSTLSLTQTDSIWWTWWWQPSWIVSSWIQPS